MTKITHLNLYLTVSEDWLPQSFTMSFLFLFFTTELGKVKHLPGFSYSNSNHVTVLLNEIWTEVFGRDSFLRVKAGTRTKLFLCLLISALRSIHFILFFLPVMNIMPESAPTPFVTMRTIATH